MNRETIMSMQTGRELDALVAEKVMGEIVQWTFGDEYTDSFPVNEYGTIIDHYSTDIAAAWEVVEKMHTDDRYNLALEWYRNEQEWGADFDELGMTTQCCAKTVQEAICKAALIATLEDDPDES